MALAGRSEGAELAPVRAAHGPAAGDEMAFGQHVVVDQLEELLRGVRDRVYRLALRMLSDPEDQRWYIDETYVRAGGTWAFLYRAVDETGRVDQVVDVLLREQHDLASARAFSARAFLQQARCRRAARPAMVITDRYAAYGRAIRRHAPRATHVRTGLHRARGEATKPVERSHAPVKDRLRAMRGLHSVVTGHSVLEAVEAAQGVRRGDLRRASCSATTAAPIPSGDRARAAALTFLLTAKDLRLPGHPPAVAWRA